MREIVNRAKAPTPRFFRVLRSIGISLVAASGVVLAAPIAIPVAITTIATYLTVAGSVVSAVSQVTVDDTQAALAVQPKKKRRTKLSKLQTP